MEESAPTNTTPTEDIAPHDVLEQSTPVSVVPNESMVGEETMGTSLETAAGALPPPLAGAPPPTGVIDARDVTNPQAAADTESTPVPSFAASAQRRLLRKLILAAGIMFGLILLMVGGTFVYQRTHKNNINQADQVAQIKPQDVSLKGTTSPAELNSLRVGVPTFFVNGDLSVQGLFRMGPKDGSYGQFSLGTLTTDQTYTLPNASGTVCLDSNNCGYVQAGGVVTSIGGAQGAINLGSGLALQGSTLVSTSGGTVVNGLVGNVTIEGTANQVIVTASGNVIKLTTPQDIATSSSPVFGGLTVNGNLFANVLQQTTAGNDLVLNAGSDNIVFSANGVSYSFPTGGPANQTICTTAITCAGGGGTAVLLAPLSVQVNSGVDTSIFINNSAGADLVKLQSNAVDTFTIANNGDTYIRGALSVNTITPTGAMTVGAAGQVLSLQGNASTTLSATAGGFTTTVGFASPTANVTYNLPTAAAGTYDLCSTAGNCAGTGGGVTTAGGTIGRIAKFTASNGIGDSLLSEVGSTVTVNGNGIVQGSLTLGVANSANGQVVLQNSSNANTITLTSAAATGNRSIVIPDASGTVAVSAAGNIALSAAGEITFTGILPVTNGGTGLGSVTANGVVVGNGTSALSTVTTGTPGQCFVSTAGAPVWTSCTGLGVVDSLNGLTGNLTIANASGSGATITIDNATTAAKGIASFNSTNFTVSSGAVNTVQNIGTGATPTFAGLNLSSALGIASGGTNSNTIGSAGSVVYSNGSSYNFTAVGSANQVLTSGGTGAPTFQNIASLLTAGTNIDISGTTNATVATVANPTFGTSVTTPLLQSAGAMSITPGGALTVGATGQQFTLQGNSSSTITATGGGFTTTIGFSGTPSGTVNYYFDRSVAAGTYGICTTVGNCAGTGSGVTTPGGTPGQLAMFSASQAIMDSIVSQSGSVITIGGSAVVQGASGLTLGVSSSANGQIVYANSTNSNTLTLQSGVTSSNLTFTLPTADGLSGQCIKTNSFGVLSFGDCLSGGGGSGVTTLNGLSGVISIANASPSGATIVIDDASTSAKGIATFNGTNFTVTSGAVNTVQNINVSATPTFAGLTATGSSSLTLGTASTNTGSILFKGSGSSATLTLLGPTAPSTNTLTLPNETGTLCSTGSVCAGYAPSSGSGNYIQNGTSIQTTANFAIQSAATGSITAVLKAIGSQTADLLQVQNSSGTPLSGIDSAGNIYVASGQSLKVTGGVSFPSSPTEGQIYYRTDTKQLYVYENSKWQADRSTATLIVAASDTQNKEKADYVATGTSDQTTINTAISALPGTGGVIVLLDGTFNVTGAVNLTSSITLTGAGASTILRIPNSTNTTFNILSASSVSRVTIQDLVVDGNRANQSSGATNCVYAINAGSGSGSTAVAGVTITNVTAKNCTDRGIYTQSIVNSVISGNTTTNNAMDGILVYQSNRVSVANNIITANGIYGIYDISTGAITYTGNVLTGNTTNGINASGSDNIITGNTITGGNIGIALGGSRVAVSGNTVSAATTGINISGSDDSVSGNTVSSNNDGITIQGASRALVSNNSIQSNTRYGIVPWNGGSGSTISDNYLYNNAGSSSDSSIAFLSGGPSNTSVVGNTIIDTAGSGYAILIPSGITGTYLSGNTYSGTGATSISDSGTNTQYVNQMDASGNVVTRGSAGIALNGTTTSYSLQNTGAFVQGGLSTPSAPTVSNQGTPGSTTWTYTVTATDGLGETVASSATTTSTGAATLNSTNYNRITPSRINGAVSYKVYRTAAGGSPATTGYIGAVSAGSATFYLNDTGLSGSGGSPTVNSTGLLAINSTGAASSFEKLRVNTATTPDVLATVTFSASATTSKVLVVQGAASQSANLQEWQSSAGAVLASVNASGNFAPTLGTTNTATYACINSSGQIAGCSGSASGAGFVNGGNSFAAAAVLGTNDNNSLTFRTNSTTACTISASNQSFSCPGSTTDTERFGAGSVASAINSVAVGSGAAATSQNSVVIGTTASQTVGGQGAEVIIGQGANATSSLGGATVVGRVATGSRQSTAIGNGAIASGSFDVALGSGASTSGGAGVAIGYNSAVTGNNSVAIGHSSAASFNNSIALGKSAATTAANQLVVGADSNAITHGYFGNGVSASTPQGFTLHASGSSTASTPGAALSLQGGNAVSISNTVGGALNLNGGQGTGTGIGGAVNIQIAKAGSSGSSNNSLTTVATWSGTDGSLLLQNATNSTAAFQVKNAAGSTSVLTVDTTNARVGIGIATPSYALDVQGGDIRLKNTGGTPTFRIDAPDSSNYSTITNTGTGGNAELSLNTGGGEGIRILNNTYVGIGTNNPQYRLDVQNGNIRLANTGTTPTFLLFNQAGSNNSSIYNGGAGSASELSFSTGGGTAITIDTNMRVALSTLGSADNATYLCRNSSNQIATCSTTATGAAFLQGGNSFGGAATLGTNDSNTLSFETNNTTQATISVGGATLFKNSTNSTTAFQVQPSGSTTPVLNVDTTNSRVGIGTATPSQALSVAGNATFLGSAELGSTNTSGVGSCNTVFGPISCNAALDMSADYTNQGSTATFGTYSIFTQTASSGANTAAYNTGSMNVVGFLGSQNITNATGVTASVVSANSATMTTVRGIESTIQNLGGGTMTTATGLYTNLSSATGTITTGNGLLVSSASGTITTNYGINVQAQTAGTSDYGIRVDAADTQTLWISGNADNTTAAAGIAFGSSRDTNLYRSAADTLKTDDNMVVATKLTVGAGTTGTYKLNVTDTTTDNVAQFNGTGANQCTVVAGTGWSCTSDARLKTNISDIQQVNALDIIKQLRPVSFNWSNSPNGVQQDGFIAQDVQQVLPQLVSTDSNGNLSLNKDGILPYVVAAMQMQQGQLQGIDMQSQANQLSTSTLSDRVDALEQKVAALELTQGQGGGSNFANLNVSGAATIQNLTVTGNANIAQLTVVGNATIGGDIKLDGHILGNADTRGSVTVPAGQTEFKHTFSRAFGVGHEPNIILTPKNAFAPSYRVESTATDFTVYFQTVAATDVIMNYQIQD